jgi:hypothetical protein
MFKEGTQIYNICIKKKGVVKYLRDDERERNIRQKNPDHFYYFVSYEDGTFDTYVYGNDLVPINKIISSNSHGPNTNTNTNTNLNENIKTTNKKFAQGILSKGTKFICKYSNKSGKIIKLRDDEYEKQQRKSYPSDYYYHVDFDDGTFETYMYGKDMILI